jgi:hypothetical protein
MLAEVEHGSISPACGRTMPEIVRGPKRNKMTEERGAAQFYHLSINVLSWVAKYGMGVACSKKHKELVIGRPSGRRSCD